MQISEHQVVIAGGGPTGLMLAGELALAGVDVAIVERRSNQGLVGSRAGGLHARTLEVLDQRGIVGRFLAEGQKAQVTGFAGVRFDISDFPTRHPYSLGLWQNHIERLLAGWVEELKVSIYRGCEVAGFNEDEAGVDVMLADGRSLRGRYLVGCDGGRSVVRKAAGIEFPGSEPTTSALIAEVEMDQEPELGVFEGPTGRYAFGRENYTIQDGKVIYAIGGPIRIMVTERDVGATEEPTLVDLKAALVAACGTDYHARNATWITRFTDRTRQAAMYRKGRVLLAGDAAHIHAPDGGFGLNTGVQDAVNLGWKLAAVVKGTASETLLDTYHAERHPVGARVLRYTMAAVALRREDDRSKALRATIGELLESKLSRDLLAAKMAGLEIRYDLGEGHPLLGRRMPDLDLETPDRKTTVYSLLHLARPVLINFGAAGGMDVRGRVDQVRPIDAGYAGPWDLPGIGPVPAPSAVLIRPDGYVAWVDDGTPAGLVEVLAKWFGLASRA